MSGADMTYSGRLGADVSVGDDTEVVDLPVTVARLWDRPDIAEDGARQITGSQTAPTRTSTPPDGGMCGPHSSPKGCPTQAGGAATLSSHNPSGHCNDGCGGAYTVDIVGHLGLSRQT